MARQAHVDKVTLAQVDLGRAAGALADHHVVLGAPLGQGLEDGTSDRKVPASTVRTASPSSTTWLEWSLPGLSSTGLNRTSGARPQAAACIAWARPSSPPRPAASIATAELLDMFCALNGATRTPRRRSQRQIPAVSTLLPASEVVPATSNPLTPASPG
jgi:hypothetical protein